MNRNRKRNSNDDGDGGQSKREKQKRKLGEGMKSARRKKILTDEDCSNSDDEVDFVFESRKKEQKMKQSYNYDDLPYIPESDNNKRMNKKGKQKKYEIVVECAWYFGECDTINIRQEKSSFGDDKAHRHYIFPPIVTNKLSR
ncbi:hypothetical protein ACS0TY_011736 [Phlomoides rotata]